MAYTTIYQLNTSAVGTVGQGWLRDTNTTAARKLRVESNSTQLSVGERRQFEVSSCT
jgi:hypothetical protein